MCFAAWICLRADYWRTFCHVSCHSAPCSWILPSTSYQLAVWRRRIELLCACEKPFNKTATGTMGIRSDLSSLIVSLDLTSRFSFWLKPYPSSKSNAIPKMSHCRKTVRKFYIKIQDGGRFQINRDDRTTEPPRKEIDPKCLNYRPYFDAQSIFLTPKLSV